MSQEQLTILVLGVGGNVGQGILKALAGCRLRCRILGACIHPTSFGLYTTDKGFLSPRADDPGFLDWLVDVCRREGVRGVLSGVEPVLEALAPHADTLKRETGAVAVVSRPDQLAVCSDKLATARWLEDTGASCPQTADAADDDAVDALVTHRGYPLIAKPRRSKGSYGLLLIHDERDLRAVRGRSGYIVQQHVGGPAEEYTAATFTNSNGRLCGSIVMRRELQQGTTVSAHIGEFPAVRKEVHHIAESLRPVGPCNMQLRVEDGKPVCFEINLRFSGTTPVRAHFGFNDVEAAVRHYVLGEPNVDLPLVTDGVALRYWNEVYVSPAAFKRLTERGVLERPDRALSSVEAYGVRQCGYL